MHHAMRTPFARAANCYSLRDATECNQLRPRLQRRRVALRYAAAGKRRARTANVGDGGGGVAGGCRGVASARKCDHGQ